MLGHMLQHAVARPWRLAASSNGCAKSLHTFLPQNKACSGDLRCPVTAGLTFACLSLQSWDLIVDGGGALKNAAALKATKIHEFFHDILGDSWKEWVPAAWLNPGRPLGSRGQS